MADLRVLRLTSVFESATVPVPGFDPVGGLQGHAGALTRALDGLGVAHEVVTAYRPGVPSTERLGEHGRVRRVGLPVRALRQLYAPPALGAALRAAAGAHVVHAHLGEDLAVLPIAELAARRHGLPLVMTIHCSLRHTVIPTDGRTAVLRWIGGALEGRATRRADAVVTITRRLAERLVHEGTHPSRIHVIPPGVDPGVLDGTPRDPLPGARRVVFVGRLVGAKGVDLLLRAFIRGAPSDAHLVFVGDGPLRSPLLEGARRAGAEHRVHVTGFVGPDGVAGHLAHAEVAVLPSRFEELGRVLLEALQVGTPVIGTRVGGIPEVIEDGRNGLLVDRGDVPGLEAAIRRVLLEPVLARRLRDGARNTAQGRTWDAVAAEHLALYRRVLRQQKRRRGRPAA